MPVSTSGKGTSRRVHELLLVHYIEPARRRQQKTVRVVAGDVIRELKLVNRAPQVCTAMQAQRFLDRYGLKIVARKGPPSGQSTTVAVTYELNGESKRQDDPLLALYGSMRHIFAAEGGGAAALRRERARWRRRPG